MALRLFLRILALGALGFFAFWTALKVVLFWFGVLAMPEDARLAIKFLHWLVETPWWVPSILFFGFAAFLGSVIWRQELSPESFKRIYGDPHEKMLRTLMKQADRNHAMALINQRESMFFDRYEALTTADYDLSTEEGFKMWRERAEHLLQVTSPCKVGDLERGLARYRSDLEGMQADTRDYEQYYSAPGGLSKDDVNIHRNLWLDIHRRRMQLRILSKSLLVPPSEYQHLLHQ